MSIKNINVLWAFKLNSDEVAQGIVAPQDFVNKHSHSVLNNYEIKINDGIFVLNEVEFQNLKLSEFEKVLEDYEVDNVEKSFLDKVIVKIKIDKSFYENIKKYLYINILDIF